MNANKRDNWKKKQTGATIRYGAEGGTVDEHMLEQSVNPIEPDSRKFQLYYFTKDFTYMRGERANASPVEDRTLLFISGGPGQVNRPGNDNFSDLAGYRIVYFHLRGAGFSQLPASNEYDTFLRTSYAVRDIEAIRKDLLGEKPWSAIIGHSYGTVLAQQYAHEYGLPGTRKLILSAPMSRHQPMKETLQFSTLESIYNSQFFDFVTESGFEINKTVADGAKDIEKRAEDEFGSVHFVAEMYERPRMQEVLREKKLDYSLAFFKALRRLRQIGWLPHDEDLAKGSNENVDTVQQLAGLVIAKEILEKLSQSYGKLDLGNRLKEVIGTPLNRELMAQLQVGRAYFSAGHVNTPRVYYCFTIQDGLDETFVRSIERGADVNAAIKSLGGKHSDMNKALSIINVENEGIERWDPKKYDHRVPTLILKGGADPVTEGGQAEYVFRQALRGERILIEFPGIGHSMSLPRMIEENKNTRDYLLEKFIGGDFGYFKQSVLPQVRRAYSDLLRKESHGRYGALNVQAKYISGISGQEVDW
jgi:pimeloyl-ACP methyl ester carboxylesterase